MIKSFYYAGFDIGLYFCCQAKSSLRQLRAIKFDAFGSKNALSLVNELDKKGVVIKLKKSDIKAKYLAGSSKGGQKANKSHSLVQLKHLPTGKTADGRESRLLPKNYDYALAKLRIAVDMHVKGDESAFTIMQKEHEEKLRIEQELKEALKQKRLENEAKLKEILSAEDTLKY